MHDKCTCYKRKPKHSHRLRRIANITEFNAIETNEPGKNETTMNGKPDSQMRDRPRQNIKIEITLFGLSCCLSTLFPCQPNRNPWTTGENQFEAIGGLVSEMIE